MGKQWTVSRYTYKLLFNEAVLARMRDRFVRQTAVPPLALVLRSIAARRERNGLHARSRAAMRLEA